jgi:hypothetical protein
MSTASTTPNIISPRHLADKDGLRKGRYIKVTLVTLCGILVIAMVRFMESRQLMKCYSPNSMLGQGNRVAVKKAMPFATRGVEEQEAFESDEEQHTPDAANNGMQLAIKTKPHEESLLKCSPWEIDMDAWWQWHPDWEPHNENETHTCFRPIQHEGKAAFFRKVYETQHHGLDCSQMRTRAIIQVGYAAYIGYVNHGFYSAFRDGRPFQMTKVYDTFRWFMTPPYDTPAGTNRSWAACPSQDSLCYFLPISSCERQMGRPEDRPARRYKHFESSLDGQVDEYLWLKSYLARPRQEVRRRLRELIQKEAPVMDPNSPCTWIHVRRGDAMTEARFARNFYPLSEYLKAGNVTRGDNILLLTDDHTTIEEAQLLHPEYQWHYWNRTRNRGAQRKNSHIPSKDEAREMLIVLAESQLAGKCKKGVHGTSNMIKMFQASMAMEHGLGNITLVSIDDDLKKVRVAPDVFMRDLESKLAAALNKTVSTK